MHYPPPPSIKVHLGGEAEAALGLHHLLQHVALDASGADVLVDHALLQVHVVHRQTHQGQPLGHGHMAQAVVCYKDRVKHGNYSVRASGLL